MIQLDFGRASRKLFSRKYLAPSSARRCTRSQATAILSLKATKLSRCICGKIVGQRVVSCEAAPMTEAEVASSSPPPKFRRLIAKRVGESFREVAEVQTWDTPSPADGEVLIRVHYAGINGGCETFRARGEYAFQGNQGKENYPLGAEAVGVVAKLGRNVDNLQVEQAVAVTGAGYSEYAIAKAPICFPLTDATPEAVAVSLSGLTAAGALLHKGELKKGETVFVSAAAGGTGHFAVQIAKLKGCRVIATCGSRQKQEALQQLHVDRVINYKEEDIGAVLREEFSQKIDVAYEGVGGELRDTVLSNLAPGGRVLGVGYISQYPHTHGRSSSNGTNSSHKSGGSSDASHGWKLPPADELFWGGQTIRHGDQVLYGQVWPEDREKIIEAKQWIFGEFDAGRIQAWIDPKRFKGLESVVDATEYMLSGQSIGKVVVDLK